MFEINIFPLLVLGIILSFLKQFKQVLFINMSATIFMGNDSVNKKKKKQKSRTKVIFHLKERDCILHSSASKNLF